MITNFCSNFVDEFLVAYCWDGLKPIGYPVVEFFDKEVGFSLRACRSFGRSFTCEDLVTEGPL